MKKVLFEMNIPDWAKWKATDCDGSVWVFSNKPHYNNGYWACHPGGDFSILLVMKLSASFSDWGYAHRTLVEIK
jgi:hypothetical protein